MRKDHNLSNPASNPENASVDVFEATWTETR